LEKLDLILKETFGDLPCTIITDSTIWKEVSGKFSRFLSVRPDTTVHILPGNPAPYASDISVAKVKAILDTSGGIPLAVGAGTINDLVKRASHERGVRYACIPTAPSVDGYTAFGAAITVKGFKVTLQCPAPLCVIADSDILQAAPAALISAGYADLVAKLTGGADWILADTLGIEPIDPEDWNLVQPVARSIFGKGPSLPSRDPSTIAELFRGLIAAGLAMQHYRDSRPASGAEHLLSHTWEMSHLEKDGKSISHGFKVALGTLISAALAEELFSPKGSLSSLLQKRAFSPAADLLGNRTKIAATLLSGTPYMEKTLAVIAAKTPETSVLSARVSKTYAQWENLAARYASQIPSFAPLKADLAAAGCPTEPAHIGLSREACLRSSKIASIIRSRYTILDLVAELGILDEAFEAVFTRERFSEYVS
jgi:glycerol-1-phosphate dehydrogenase [NAD(P)+]